MPIFIPAPLTASVAPSIPDEAEGRASSRSRAGSQQKRLAHARIGTVGLHINGLPDDADAYNMGTSLLALGRAEEAAVRFRRALALAPRNAKALNNLGNGRAGPDQRG
jgi:hypothetical protein